jgi:hypothetical protein
LKLGAGLLMLGASAAMAAGTGASPIAAPVTSPVAPAAPLRIPLEPLGFQPLLEDFLLEGSSGLTVDFVDNDHLLVTFQAQHLMRREPDARPEDDDRMIEAVLVELPSGRALARAEWRVHDRMQYLWNLGHGRFLLRVRDRLTMLAPLAQLGTEQPFAGEPLLDEPERHVVAVLVSSNQDLLTVETMRRLGGAAGTASNVTFAGTEKDEAPVQIRFYRLAETADGLAAAPAGVIRTRVAVAIPMTTAGFLEVLEGGKNRWLFNFNEHAGKVDELAEWDTSCFPRPTFVGHSEFVAFGCRGSDDKLEIAGFNLKGEEMWEQGLYENYVSPTFDFAPAAGRFALERTMVSVLMDADASLSSGAVAGEEVRVYQAYNGKVLLKADCSPVERAAQNYALSPDGLRLAVTQQTAVRQRTTQLGDPYTESSTAVAVYSLPPLSEQDQAAVKAEAAQAPADVGARIDESLTRAPADAGGRGAVKRASAAGSPAKTAAAGKSAVGASASVAAGVNADAASGSQGASAAQEPGNPAIIDPEGMARAAEPKAEPKAGAQNLPDAPGAAPDGSQSGTRAAPTLLAPDEKTQDPAKAKQKEKAQ